VLWVIIFDYLVGKNNSKNILKIFCLNEIKALTFALPTKMG
jgi:hypothetical protein